jgi:DNA-directed RNA polymerase subunit M/transcription elongation factor TFIIS
MLSLKDEMPMWANISEKLDRFFAAKKGGNVTCPSCGKTDVSVEILETMSGLRMGFFSCTFCGENWAGPVK